MPHGKGVMFSWKPFSIAVGGGATKPDFIIYEGEFRKGLFHGTGKGNKLVYVNLSNEMGF